MALADDIIQRHSKLATERSNFDSLNQEIAEYVLPDHAVFTIKDRMQGERRTQKQYETTAMTSAMQHAAAVDSLATPHSARWHTLNSLDPKLNERDDVQQYFADVEEILFSERYAEHTDFAAQIYDVYRTGGVFGTTAFFIGDKTGGGLQYKALPSAETFLNIDAWGRVCEFHRKWKMTAYAAYKEYGDRLPKKIAESVTKEPLRKWEFLMCVKPNDEKLTGYLDYRSMPYVSYEIQVEEKEVLRVGGFESWPIPVYRYDVAPGEWYGRGWAASVFPEIKMLNVIRKAYIRQTEKAADPPLLAHDDGMLSYGSNGQEQTPTLGSGEITWGGMSADGKPLVAPLYTGADLSRALELMEKGRRIVQDAALISLFQILLDNPKFTATEYLGRMQEKAQLLGPMVGRSLSTFLAGVVERELDILNRQGKLPEMPVALQRVDGAYQVQFNSPLSRLMRLGDVTATEQWLSSLIPLAELRPDIFDNADIDEFARYAAQRRGVPPAIVVDREVRDQLRKKRQEEAALQQAIESAEPLANAAKTTAQAGAIAQEAQIGRAFQSLRGALKGN